MPCHSASRRQSIQRVGKKSNVSCCQENFLCEAQKRHDRNKSSGFYVHAEGSVRDVAKKVVETQPPYDRAYTHLTTLWGATCHQMDKLEDVVPFFEVSVNEWLLMDNVGAYGLVPASGFYGTAFFSTRSLPHHSGGWSSRAQDYRRLSSHFWLQPASGRRQEGIWLSTSRQRDCAFLPFPLVVLPKGALTKKE
ncbi:hypothetical protein V5799_029798 [Amblyomma americanum]|uniref:Uncharacterized protein n=1 Tax=Amblyomma americanum TaxID=6943 RepID=A0AAQ4EQ65_AMBAM